MTVVTIHTDSHWGKQQTEKEQAVAFHEIWDRNTDQFCFGWVVSPWCICVVLVHSCVIRQIFSMLTERRVGRQPWFLIPRVSMRHSWEVSRKQITFTHNPPPPYFLNLSSIKPAHRWTKKKKRVKQQNCGYDCFSHYLYLKVARL